MSRWSVPGVVFLAPALVVGLTSLQAQAQSLPIGRALFHRHCQACHAVPPQFVSDDPQGQANARLIGAAIARNRGGMGSMAFLSTQDLHDIGGYIGRGWPAPVPSANVLEHAIDRVLDWAEWKYQGLLLPRSDSRPVSGYRARYFASRAWYVGSDGQGVYLYNDEQGLQALGSLQSFLELAAADGF